MRTTALLLICVFFAGLGGCGDRPSRTDDIPEPYTKITITPVLSQAIIRDRGDRVYSGQIRSLPGLLEFEKTYGIVLDKQDLDFTKRMLIFGITDHIATRAFQFLKQEHTREFTLDYADTGIVYKLANPGEGKKHSYLQVFVLDRMDEITHIRVKNLVGDGLSRVYDQ